MHSPATPLPSGWTSRPDPACERSDGDLRRRAGRGMRRYPTGEGVRRTKRTRNAARWNGDSRAKADRRRQRRRRVPEGAERHGLPYSLRRQSRHICLPEGPRGGRSGRGVLRSRIPLPNPRCTRERGKKECRHASDTPDPHDPYLPLPKPQIAPSSPRVNPGRLAYHCESSTRRHVLVR